MTDSKKYLFSFIAVLLFCCSCKQAADKLFTSLPPSTTGIDFANKLPEKSGLGILSYIYYYNGGGVSVGDINNDGLPDIYFTANSKGNNKLYLNKGNFEFEDITGKAGVAGSSDWCTGTTMADVNGDGLLDIYVCAVANVHGLKGHNELFINQGNGTFKESAALYGLDFSGLSTQAVFFDYDHDGDLDCFLVNQSEHPNQNIGDTANRRRPDALSGERLFRNDVVNGQCKFTDVSAQAGIYQSKLGYGLGVAVADVNNDGWDDIYVGNDFHENDYYYINNGNGTFTENGSSHFKHYSRYSMGNDIADFNNDGQPDVFTADMLPGEEKTLKTYGNGEVLDVYNQKITKNGFQNQYSKNCLQVNNGDGISFSDVSLISGVAATDWSWSPLFADFDNDGNKDLFISTGIEKRPLDLDFINFFSGIKNPQSFGTPAEFEKALLNKMPDGWSHPFLFKGDGQMAFKDESDAWGTGGMKGSFNGAAYADFNNDGKTDIVINCLNAPAVVLKNNAPPKNYLTLTFKGDGMNKNGIGVKAWLFTKGKMQYQQLMLTRGFMSSVEPRLHFGLDSIATADSLLIVWPSQKYQLLKNVAAGKALICNQSEATAVFNYHDFFPPKKELFTDISTLVNVQWKHEEDKYTDFNTQYLLPHMESTRGPKLAVADVNGDGLEDFFVCGAKGQAGCLMLQTKDGHFTKSDTAVFNKNNNCEGVDAVFFDANNDGYKDLFVVSGGNEYDNGNAGLADHLYINDGRGHFTESAGNLPLLLTNKSCVAIADVNKDGYNDIFIGELAEVKKYGYTKASSHLLLNDKAGHFTLAGDATISLHGIGAVTTAAFADVNKDGWPDLVVTGEWMGIKIFINQQGVFKESEIPKSSGLWQTVAITDINGDGYPDMLAGNWGLNSKLSAGKDGPLKLYTKDFDGNGSIESIITYAVDGKDYPFLGKDQLEITLPVLKKQHLSYDEVAGQPVQYMFGQMFTNPDPVQLQAQTLASAYAMNDGKGNFNLRPLPLELQLSPVFTFTSQHNAWMAAGNFYGVLPYEGRYDALLPTLFSYNNKLGQMQLTNTLPKIDGEVRDAKWISYGRKKILIIARNNQPLIFLQPTD